MKDRLNYYSDYHKDLHGFRPKEIPETAAELEEKITELDNYFFMLESTPGGRDYLQSLGFTSNLHIKTVML